MPVYNGERFLRAAIDSVLAQTFTDFELVMIDDGSRDNSRVILESYADWRIRVIHHERNLGLATTLNHGLEAASGALVARHDQDDLSSPARLARQRMYLLEHPDVALVGSQAAAIDEEGHPAAPVNRSLEHDSIRWYGLFATPFIHSSVMFRRRIVWDELGGYDASFDPYAEDFDLWSRLLRGHRTANLSERLVTYRVNQASTIGALQDAEHRVDHDQRFVALMRQIVKRNVRELFGQEVSDAQAESMAGFVLGVSARELPSFLAAFRRLLALYRSTHPAAASTGDFCRTLAHQFDAIAYRIVGGNRRTALSVYLAALTEDAGIWTHVSWVSACALLLFGRHGRARMGQSGLARAIRAMRS